MKPRRKLKSEKQTFYSLFHKRRRKENGRGFIVMATTTLKYRTKTSASSKCPFGVKKKIKIKCILPHSIAVWLISAGTRTRSLWIRSPARYSIAPQRLRQHDTALVHFYIHIPPVSPYSVSLQHQDQSETTSTGGHQGVLFPLVSLTRVGNVALECLQNKSRPV